MGNGDTAGFLRVILEVSLNIFISVVTDNLNRVFVSTNGTVTAKTPELALDSAFCCGVGCFFLVEREAGNVIVNTDSELSLRLVLAEFLVNSENAGRGSVLRTETVTAADNSVNLSALYCQSSNNI